MTIEQFIMFFLFIIPIASLLYIPREKLRLAIVSFLVFHAFTWAGCIILVQTGSIEYPVRIFTYSTKVGFTQNFLFIPMVFTWFILIFPINSSFTKKVLHYFIFISIIVWFIYFISIYTNLQEFLKETEKSQPMRLYINFAFYFVICHLYVDWFSKKAIEGKGNYYD
ncbi:putative membrane protein [Metabacillus crassostreae]|uniref:CBO0543 family protein n=1 Tax=Metabacillus crassostreae TaxID=929098 RepID=UPI00195625DF|nr:CBO0543 family protein [Metabacillus crassostreae]MBM7602572.1 putative membrane protein [Metabacillus crassostreae]